jgi:hypothetical protein
VGIVKTAAKASGDTRFLTRKRPGSWTRSLADAIVEHHTDAHLERSGMKTLLMSLNIRFATSADAFVILDLIKQLAAFEREPHAVELNAA